MECSPYGEAEEPCWRTHDGSFGCEMALAGPVCAPSFSRRKGDPDWDDSRWMLGEHYWLGRRYHKDHWWHRWLVALGWKRRKFPDPVVADEVKEALAREPLVEVSDLTVRVSRGRVTLTGLAADHWIRDEAEESIYFLPGVEGVDNRITSREAA